ncbi:hypothetical protein ACHAXN_002231 [Cyclotella atomus]
MMFYNNPGEDGTWATISMVEGTNQGCPLSSTLVALLHHTVLAPVTALLHQRAAACLAQGNKGDDGLGGLSLPLACIDDKNTVIYLPDIQFFLSKLQPRMPSQGMFIQCLKTRILTTSGSSALPAICNEFGPVIASEIKSAIATFSAKPAPTAKDPTATATTPCKVIDGLHVLGQPVGSPSFFHQFLTNATNHTKNQDDRTTLLLPHRQSYHHAPLHHVRHA